MQSYYFFGHYPLFRTTKRNNEFVVRISRSYCSSQYAYNKKKKKSKQEPMRNRHGDNGIQGQVTKINPIRLNSQIETKTDDSIKLTIVFIFFIKQTIYFKACYIMLPNTRTALKSKFTANTFSTLYLYRRFFSDHLYSLFYIVFIK